MNMTLIEARGLLEWTQTRLAEETGVGISVINGIERGRVGSPSHALAMKIVNALRRGGMPGLQPEQIAFSSADAPQEGAVA